MPRRNCDHFHWHSVIKCLYDVISVQINVILMCSCTGRNFLAYCLSLFNSDEIVNIFFPFFSEVRRRTQGKRLIATLMKFPPNKKTID